MGHLCGIRHFGLRWGVALLWPVGAARGDEAIPVPTEGSLIANTEDEEQPASSGGQTVIVIPGPGRPTSAADRARQGMDESRKRMDDMRNRMRGRAGRLR